MGLQIISETAEAVSKQPLFSQAEQQFIMEFAFKTNDGELTDKLMEELAKQEKDANAIMVRYTAMLDEKPQWIGRIENLLVALERYRMEEEKAVNHLAEILSAYGIDVSAEEIRKINTDDLKERIKKEAALL